MSVSLISAKCFAFSLLPGDDWTKIQIGSIDENAGPFKVFSRLLDRENIGLGCFKNAPAEHHRKNGQI